MADALDELYLGDFDGFVARRNDLAKRLRADGDAESADRVRGLSKPSRVAWAVNQFGARQKKLAGQLLDAGEKLRAAQAALVSGKGDGAALKRARSDERAVVTKAITAIEKLVEADGASLSAAAADRVRQTLHAVALDEDVRGDFEAHRLEADRDATGLSEIPSAPAHGARSRAKKQDTKVKQRRADEAEAKRQREALKKARAELRSAEHEQLEAEKALTAAQLAADKAAKRADRARTRAEELEGELAVPSSTRELTYLRGLGLSDVDLARATGPGDAQRLTDLSAVVRRIEQLIDRTDVAQWLRTSIPELRWATPLDLIGQRALEPLHDVLAELEERARDATTLD